MRQLNNPAFASPLATRSASSGRSGCRAMCSLNEYFGLISLSSPALDHADRGRGRNQAARPEPQREAEGDIARAARFKAKQGQEKLKRAYGQLLNSTGRVAGQAKRFSQEIAAGVKRSADVIQQLTLEGLRDKLDAMVALVRKVMKQTRARILRGDTRGDGKLVSLFEPETEIIRKGKAGKPTEFGKMVKLQEAENQIVTDYEVYDRRPNDADLLIAAVEMLSKMRRPRPPGAECVRALRDAIGNADPFDALGFRRRLVLRSTKSPERRREQKKRWFRQGQKWRTDCEGRISVVKRRHGLNRCRYKGDAGMKRWVGLGVIADNLINIGRAMAKQSGP